LNDLSLSSTETLIVVPCYNEEKRLDAAAFHAFAQANPAIHFLFVDDGSSDGTKALLQQMCAGQPASFSSLHLPKNQGKAEAVRQGFLKGFERNAQYIGYWDADLATPLRTILDFAAVLNTKPQVEVVTGARVRLAQKRIERSMSRHYLGRLFATAAGNLFHFPMYDTQCGAKLFRASPALLEACSDHFLSRWIFDVELLLRLHHATRKNSPVSWELLIHEFPLEEWRHCKDSKMKISHILMVPWELLRVYRSWKKHTCPTNPVIK